MYLRTRLSFPLELKTQATPWTMCGSRCQWPVHTYTRELCSYTTHLACKQGKSCGPDAPLLLAALGMQAQQRKGIATGHMGQAG